MRWRDSSPAEYLTRARRQQLAYEHSEGGGHGRITLSRSRGDHRKAALRRRAIGPQDVEGLLRDRSGVVVGPVQLDPSHQDVRIDGLEQPEGVEGVLLLESVRLPVGLRETLGNLDDLRREQRALPARLSGRSSSANANSSTSHGAGIATQHTRA